MLTLKVFIVFGGRDNAVSGKVYVLPNWLGNIVVVMAETTYYEDKVYLPREVREKLGLVDGDVLHIEVVEKGVARLSIVRGATQPRKLLQSSITRRTSEKQRENSQGQRFMKILLDTNILVHAYNKASPHQKKASNVIKRAVQGEIDAFLAPQILYEFFAIVTNPKRVEHPMPLDEATDLCVDFWECREIEKANPTTMVPKEVFKLAKELKLSKGGVFGCVLAVTAKENKVETIYTENVDDFENYRFIKAINPLT